MVSKVRGQRLEAMNHDIVQQKTMLNAGECIIWILSDFRFHSNHAMFGSSFLLVFLVRMIILLKFSRIIFNIIFIHLRIIVYNDHNVNKYSLVSTPIRLAISYNQVKLTSTGPKAKFYQPVKITHRFLA